MSHIYIYDFYSSVLPKVDLSQSRFSNKSITYNNPLKKNNNTKSKKSQHLFKDTTQSSLSMWLFPMLMLFVNSIIIKLVIKIWSTIFILKSQGWRCGCLDLILKAFKTVLMVPCPPLWVYFPLDMFTLTDTPSQSHGFFQHFVIIYQIIGHTKISLSIY